MIDRVSRPMQFRLVLQPVMAAILAIVAGLKDAKAGKSPYFWALAADPTHAISHFPNQPYAANIGTPNNDFQTDNHANVSPLKPAHGPRHRPGKNGCHPIKLQSVNPSTGVLQNAVFRQIPPDLLVQLSVGQS
jgi:hypothetical protein